MSWNTSGHDTFEPLEIHKLKVNKYKIKTLFKIKNPPNSCWLVKKIPLALQRLQLFLPTSGE